MNREKIDKLFKPFRPSVIKLGERRQVFSYLFLLFFAFTKKTVGNHIGDIRFLYSYLFKPILYSTQTLRHKLEAIGVKYGFLQAGNEAEFQILTDLADFSKKTKIQRKLLLVSGTEIIEELIDHDQKPLPGELIFKNTHQILK